MGLDAAIFADEDCSHRLQTLRIGNAAMVSHLAEAIRHLNPDSDILLGKVLYSASHSGDRLELNDVAGALEELRGLKMISINDPGLQRFLNEFDQLLVRARELALPVVF